MSLREIPSRSVTSAKDGSTVRKRVSVIVAAGILATGLVVVALPAAAATPTGKASPSKNLSDGQSVKVSGTGWPASDSLAIVECNANAASSDPNACDQADFVLVSANSKGAVAPTPFTVKAGSIGDGTCNPGQTCYLVLSEPSASGLHALIKIVINKIVKGSVTCDLAPTTVTFSPPLLASGKPHAEVTKIASTTLSNCSSSTGGSPSGGTLTSKPISTPVSKGGNLCSAFTSNAAISKFQFTIKWNNGASTSVVKFTGAAATSTGFTLSAGKVTGSFATPTGASASVIGSASDLVNILNCSGGGPPFTVSALAITGGTVAP